MTIIKNKLTQMVLVGICFAFILGTLSYVVRNGFNKPIYEKQIVIIDVYYKNKITESLGKINQISYLNRNLAFSEELFSSIEYIRLRYKKDKRLSAGCYNIQMNLTDESIFLETLSYPTQNKMRMDQCLSNLFELSYKRFKDKLDVYNYRTISLLNSELDQANKESDFNLLAKKDKKIEEFTKIICSDLDKITTRLNLEGEKELHLGGKIEYDSEKKNVGINFLSLFNLQQSFIALKTLEEICDDSFNYNIFKKKEFIFHLNALKDLTSQTKFDDIFKVEKITENINETNQYLSTKNIILTFSIFGFFFGALLVYNFRSLKDKNE